MQLYNIFYTSFPIMIYAMFDSEHEPEELKKKSYLYVGGREGHYFNFYGFW